MVRIVFRPLTALGFGALIAGLAQPARAVPSFERQTGMECAACHTIYPELTALGRQFKLRGYTSGTQLQDKKFPFNLPLAGVVVPSINSTRNTSHVDPETITRDGELSLQEAGIYYGGRIAGNFGALAQYNYDGIEGKWGVEMVDVRYADTVAFPGGQNLIWGVTLNNNPTLADIYNSTPMWSFPHLSTDKAVTPATRALVDMSLFRQVGGVGVYGFWNNFLYGEFTLYRTTNSGIMRPLGEGAEKEIVVKGYAPYWRLAVEQSWGAHMLMVGTFGLIARVYPDRNNLNTPADRFRDIGFDAEYHFDTGEHAVTAHAAWIREKRSWDASFQMGAASNASDRLTTVRGDIHYMYQRQYGFGVQRFSTAGDADQVLYNTGEPVTGSLAGSPGTRGWQFNVYYLPVDWVQIGIRYTAYERFNGARTGYDGFGRNAADNNATYLYAWILL
jgi:hypothetical protein